MLDRMRSALAVTFVLLTCPFACKGSPSIKVRVEGNTACLPNIWVVTNSDGSASSDQIDHAPIPWEKQLPAGRDSVRVEVFNGSEDPKTQHGPDHPCPTVQCQIIIDGKSEVVRADAYHPVCSWSR